MSVTPHQYSHTLENILWRKSTRSPSNGGQCVEAGSAHNKMHLRDSKLDSVSPILSLTKTDFAALLYHLD